jgi:hypothetical protein
VLLKGLFGLALQGSLHGHPVKGAVLGDDHVVVIASPHESVLDCLEDLLHTMLLFFACHAGQRKRSPLVPVSVLFLKPAWPGWKW